ncbi:MAG TPA: SH3 domain-containing protein [Candidatus Sulfotelmatobacter sp.]|nr:SH3 domain-containing protein [Candidatus Sulfotelmatobacter sp.]
MRLFTFAITLRIKALGSRRQHGWRAPFSTILLTLGMIVLPLLAHAREKDTTQYGAGLIVNVPSPEADVQQAVQEVIQNGIIRGSKEYERDQYVTGAEVATSVRGFPAWQEPGTVFYKIRTHALDPRNFKESGDVGTLAVRYVVQPQGEQNTVLRIDAIFVEDFRHVVHPSNGSVEGAEYKDIHDHLEILRALKQQAKDAAAQHTQVNEKLLRGETAGPVLPVQTRPATQTAGNEGKPATEANESPEEHLKNLRRQLERVVKPPGAPLKASPFQSAKTLVSLPSGTEVLIVISTPYWVGVETHEGQHGWVYRDDLELAP